MVAYKPHPDEAMKHEHRNVFDPTWADADRGGVKKMVKKKRHGSSMEEEEEVEVEVELTTRYPKVKNLTFDRH